jgi:predicted enzyme related to lactoylglutathione lyase
MAREPAGRFCWLDLAATDAPRAIEFYGELFGWRARTQAANGGTFVRLARDGTDVGSLYPLPPAAKSAGVASHWTPYVRVDDLRATARQAQALGGSVLVDPFVVEGVARIAVVVDPGGAAFGLWEDIE